MKKENFRKETICVQGNYDPQNGEPRTLPLYQSTTYKYDDCDEVAALFDLEKAGHMYSRISNPTVAAFEEKIAMLEGGVGALATSSGQAATLIGVTNICYNGDHILAGNNIYGGTYNLLKTSLSKFGIEVSFFDPSLSVDEIVALAKDNTKLIFGETIGNPVLNILDIEKFAQVAKLVNIPLMVDNTLATPMLCNPIAHGANIVMHSTTKYIDGHATCLGGIIVDGGNFDWANGKFPCLTENDPSYHGVSYTETFGNDAYITKARVQLMRDFGSTMSPFNAFMTNLGTESLHVRMKAHCENALIVAKYLEKHPKVSWVNYPGLETSPEYGLVEKYLGAKGGGVLTFGVKGDLEDGKKFVKNLDMIKLVVHVADARSCIIHPASTTHRQMTAKELEDSKISTDLMRLSIGIENVEDIIADIEQAFA